MSQQIISELHNYLEYSYPLDSIVKLEDLNDNISCDCLLVGINVGVVTEKFQIIKNCRITGYDIVISKIIADELAKPLVFVEADSSQLIDSLYNGQIDLIVSNMNITPYRSRKIAQIAYYPGVITKYNLLMPRPTYNELQQFVTDSEYIKALDKISTYPTGIGVIADSVTEHYLNSLYKANSIVNLVSVYTKPPDTTELLDNGTIAAYLTPVKLVNGSSNLVNVETKISIPSEYVGDLGIGVNIECCCLINRVYSIINKLYQSGVLKLISDYFDNPKAFRGCIDFNNNNFTLNLIKPECLDLTTRCANKSNYITNPKDFCYPVQKIVESAQQNPSILRVGIDEYTLDLAEPNMFLKHDNINDCIYGYDVKMAYLLSQYLNRKLLYVKIVDRIDPLQEGLVDVVISQTNKTTYRSKRVAQIPYYPYSSKYLNLVMNIETFDRIKCNVNDQDYISQLSGNIYAPAGTTANHYIRTLQSIGKATNLNIISNVSHNQKELLESGFAVALFSDFAIFIDDPHIVNVNTKIMIKSEYIGPFAINVPNQCCQLINAVRQMVDAIN